MLGEGCVPEECEDRHDGVLVEPVCGEVGLPACQQKSVLSDGAIRYPSAVWLQEASDAYVACVMVLVALRALGSETAFSCVPLKAPAGHAAKSADARHGLSHQTEC